LPSALLADRRFVRDSNPPFSIFRDRRFWNFPFQPIVKLLSDVSRVAPASALSNCRGLMAAYSRSSHLEANAPDLVRFPGLCRLHQYADAFLSLLLYSP
jgi:hypothetical protein